MVPMRVNQCASCGSPLTQPARGRPRRYCSERCRQRAKRERQSQAALAILAGLTARPEPEPEPVQDLVLEVARVEGDPDEALALELARCKATSIRLAILAGCTRPQFSWRCAGLAGHIAAGLERFFKS